MADPALREAWEVHRWGLLGTIETTANFAAGLIIEILARANNAVTGMVDRFFESVAAKDLAYYDHPSGRAYIESDTLGLLLRLHPNSSRTTGQRDVLDDYLQLLLRHVKDDGSFPVWLIDDPNTTAVVMGEGCGTIEANLLRGLLTSGGPKHLPWAVAAAGRLLARYAELGVGINVNYPRSFALGVLAELLDDLGRVGPPAVMALVRDAQVRVRVEIEQVSTRSRPSPQDAACLLWACARPWLSDLPQPSWRQTVLSAQLFDGGWPAEAIFFAPGPGGRTQWHSSRLVTTALCYQALLLA